MEKRTNYWSYAEYPFNKSLCILKKNGTFFYRGFGAFLNGIDAAWSSENEICSQII